MDNFDKQALFWGLTGVVAVWLSSVLIIIEGLQVSIVGAAIVIASALAFKYPRLGLWLFLIYLPFSGTVTYWSSFVYQAINGWVNYSSAYAWLHSAKDALYFPALLGLLGGTQTSEKLRPTINPLLIAVFGLMATCCATLLFVNLPQQLDAVNGSPFFMGVVGLKTTVGYIPLVLCTYYLVRDRQDLLFLTRLQVVLSLICCSLCFFQYLLLIDGICTGSSNLPDPAYYKASLQAKCFVGGSLLYNPQLNLLRLPGTFVSPWQWGWFLISNSFFTYTAFTSDPSRTWRSFSLGTMVLILVAAVVSGQKLALLLVPTIMLILLLLTEWQDQQLPIKLGILSFLSIFTANQLQVVQQQLSGLVERWNYSPPLKFMIEQLSWIVNNHLVWLGNGLGRATSAARRWGEIKLIEAFHAKLLYEVGIVGAIAFLAVVTVLTILTFKAYRSLKSPSLRRLGLCLWLFIFFISYNPYYYPLSVDPVAVYYWLVAGVLLKLPELDI